MEGLSTSFTGYLSHNSDCHKYPILQLFTKIHPLIIGSLHKGGSKCKNPQLREWPLGALGGGVS
jgi:hypothetical protein